MTDWATFAVGTIGLTILLLILTRRSQRLLERSEIGDRRQDTSSPIGDSETGVVVDRESDGPVNSEGNHVVDRESDGPVNSEGNHVVDRESDGAGDWRSDGVVDRESDPSTRGEVDIDGNDDVTHDRPVLTTELLLANAALSQLFALSALVAVAWWTGVPAAAFGLGAGDPLSVSMAVSLGAAAGVALYVANEVAAALGARVGVSASERLREAMAPDDARGWGLLFGVVLPIIAVFEEALFRGALIGALAVGFAVDPWLLAVGSSVAFGLGHGAQGRLGIAVTGALGLLLAALFIYTGRLLVVIVAHYVVNAAEFVVREGLGLDPLGSGQ